jgi:hypothetical protein
MPLGAAADASQQTQIFCYRCDGWNRSGGTLAFDLLHAIQFWPTPHPRSAACALPSRLLRVTVTDRCIPLVTAAYGMRVARPARTTRLAPGGDGSQLT